MKNKISLLHLSLLILLTLSFNSCKKESDLKQIDNEMSSLELATLRSCKIPENLQEVADKYPAVQGLHPDLIEFLYRGDLYMAMAKLSEGTDCENNLKLAYEAANKVLKDRNLPTIENPTVSIPVVSFGTPDNTSIGYEVESESATEGSCNVSWYCYHYIKGSEKVSFKSYDRIKYGIAETSGFGYYSKTHYFLSTEHITMLDEGKIKGQKAIPMLAYTDDLTTHNLARISVVFKDKREVRNADGTTYTESSRDMTSVKSWTIGDIGLKDIK